MITALLLAGLALTLAYIGSQRRLSTLGMLFVVLFVGAGAFFVARPDLANRAAAAVGVGRGADLLLYFAVLAGILIAANFYFRFKQNEGLLTSIVRRVAITSPIQEREPAEGSAGFPLARAWVVIPAYNEAQVMRQVVREVRELVPRVVVVDDGSEDSTQAEASAAGAVVLRHAVNLGQGAALQTGIEYAIASGADYIFTFDGDGQHTPDSLLALAKVQRETNADVVLGSRALGQAENIPRARIFMLKAATWFTRLHSGLKVSDTHNGLRLLTRKAAIEIRLTQPKMAHASELLARIRALGLQFAEAPVRVRYTEYSMRKGQSGGGALPILLDILYKRWTK